MDVICNKETQCNSTECPHKKGHEHNAGWCEPGQCRWSPSSQCVPVLEYQIMDILKDYFGKDIDTSFATKAILDLINKKSIIEVIA